MLVTALQKHAAVPVASLGRAALAAVFEQPFAVSPSLRWQCVRLAGLAQIAS